MRKTINAKRLWQQARQVLVCACLLGVVSCSEDIDSGDYAIKTEQTVTDYLKTNSELSDIKAVFDRVRLGRSDSASSLSNVLSCRGNYTVFAPTNDAMKVHLQQYGASTVAELTDEEARLVALNCVIDNGETDAYETSDFPTQGTFAIANLNDRLLTCVLDTADSESGYIINGTARLIRSDVQVSNGMVHEVGTVISPSSDFLPQRLETAPNMKISSHLINQTHWADSLLDYIDQDYENANWEEMTDYRLASEPNHVIIRNTHRYTGYTALLEPDDVYAAEWGVNLQTDAGGNVTNWDEVMNIIRQKCEEVYGTTDAEDITSPDNAINRFVAYHLLYGRMAYDRFVRHLNEYGYKFGDIKNPQTANCPTNIWDYYTTMGKHRGLLKITQVGDGGFESDLDHKIYVNRISVYDNSRTGDYHEISAPEPGVLISPDNGAYDNNALNGFYFPINKMLLYTTDIRRRLGAERIRVDMVTMLPEIASNNNRGKDYRLFPKGYFNNIFNESSDTKTLYVADQYGGGWNDYQGDEFLFCGLYDFVLRLPPVPLNGTYELRMGVGMNSLRGMAQIYFGDDPVRLAPVGLPFDMRQQVSSTNTEIPWVADISDDAVNAENDKNLRNHGYLKGPQYFMTTDGTATTPVRQRSGSVACIRRIITVARMEAGKTYYLRFKSALRKLDSQFFLDYFEFVPTVIYNGVDPEDIW